MVSDVPKPIRRIAGRAMAAHVLHALSDAGVQQTVVVAPPASRGEQIRHVLQADCPAGMTLRFAVQVEPRGTADALLTARQEIHTRYALVVNGDLPLLTTDQLEPVLNAEPVDVTLAAATVGDPAKMGRIVRDQAGEFNAIVEWNDATAEERQIAEVNLGIYRFRTDFLWPALDHVVQCTTSSDESYATDVIPLAVERASADAIEVPLPDGRLNVETPADAADAEDRLRSRITAQLLATGVHLPDRRAVWIDAQAQIAAGATIEPGSHIRGASVIGPNSIVGPNAVIDDSQLGSNCLVESCTIRGSVLDDHVEVGPYSTIRPDCEIGPNVHIGTHAELKAAQIGEGVQIGHFSYIGDATVGARANIGAGAITCNFDGQDKHQTQIGADAFIGCDTMLIAPITIGDRARTGAGAVVNKDVPDAGNAVGHPARLIPSRRQRSEPSA